MLRVFYRGVGLLSGILHSSGRPGVLSLGLHYFVINKACFVFISDSPPGFEFLGRNVLLNTAPFHAECTEGCETCHDNADLETLTEGIVIDFQSHSMVLFGYATDNLRCARSLDQLGSDTDTWDVGETLRQLVGEDVLTHGSEDSTEELLAEEHERGSDCDVLAWKNGLCGHVRSLRARPQAVAVYDLKANPFTLGRVGGQGGQ